MSNNNNNNNLTLILSTGRTGTKFLEEYINNTFLFGFCVHEPKPSRIFKLLSNLREQEIVSNKLIANYYLKRREQYFGLDKQYIESNPFLFNCAQSIKLRFPNVKILHIVRHPKGYIHSHIDHGFWRGLKRLVFEYAPFWDETWKVNKPDPKDPLMILIARWYIVNLTIQALGEGNEYYLVRFEDLFNKNEIISNNTINSIRKFLGEEEIGINENMKWRSVRVNKSTNNLWEKFKFNSKHEQYLSDLCGKLMSEYGYVMIVMLLIFPRFHFS